MKIAVTGATGFVGQALMRRLGAQARALSLRAPEQQWAPVLQGVDCVVHLAARVHHMHQHGADALAQYRAANTALTIALARRAAQAGVRRLVFISSVKVCGESSRPGVPWTAQDEPNPHDGYAVSKLEAERALALIGAELGLEVVIVRPPLVYGPGVKANFASLLQLVRRQIPLPLAALDNRRSLLALDNLVDFIELCTRHPAAAGGTFLVSDGDDVATPELIRRIAQAWGVRARLFSVPPAILAGLARLTGKTAALERLSGNLQVDISPACTQLGWTPPVRMQDCLRRTIQDHQL